MSDYSEIATNVLNGLRRQNVVTLLRLISSLDVRDLRYMRRRYEEEATAFDATIECLKQIGLIRDKGDRLVTAPSISHDCQSDAAISRTVLTAIATLHRTRPLLNEYLKTFRVVQGRITRRSNAAPTEHASVRDFLMDFDVLSFDIGKGEYCLASDVIQLYVDAHRNRSRTTPTTLDRLLNEKSDIGMQAELAIVQYEQKRVGTAFASRVNHTALDDTTAGYDIESVTMVEHRVVPRCIEVKAVSDVDHGFYWTANEIRMAETLREYYYLYLLPFTGDSKLRLDRLRIICDPCDTVLWQNGEWTVEESVVRCQLRSPCKGET